MTTTALLVHTPPLRCYARREDSARPLCGDLAQWYRPAAREGDVGYYCERHCLATDMAIPAGAMCRRVRIQAIIEFSGVSLTPAIAQIEAVHRLETGVGSLLGRLDVLVVSSLIGRASPLGLARQPPASEGDLE